MMQPTPNETQIHTDELVDIREVSVDACFAGNGVTLEECLQGILR